MRPNDMSWAGTLQSTVADTTKVVADTAKTVVDTAKAAVDSAKADTNLFKFLDDYSNGIFVLFFSLAAIVLLIQWLAWIFLQGRFKPKPPEPGTGTGTGDGSRRSDLRYVIADFFVKLINDFRHLLALLLVVIFALTLVFMLSRAGSADKTKTMADMTDALQVVVATLGGLIGSILGYYFGESAVLKKRDEGDGGDSGTPPKQGGGPPSPPNDGEEPPLPAPPPR